MKPIKYPQTNICNWGPSMKLTEGDFVLFDEIYFQLSN